MTIYEKTIDKIRELPESLIEEVNDFVDFLKQDSSRWQFWLLLKKC